MPVISVQKCRVPVSCVGGVAGVEKRPELRVSEFASVRASQVRQSPRMALAPAFEALRRAAEARKCRRIARRLASFTGERVRQRSWSSAKSAGGVH